MLATTILAALACLVHAVNGAYTDASCRSASLGNYSCVYGATACGSVCGMGSTTVGTASCCALKPPACEPIDFPSYTSCYNNALCYGDWANSGPCSGCGAGGSQTQVQPCNGKTGVSKTRTIIVTCGSLAIDFYMGLSHKLLTISSGTASYWNWTGWTLCSPSCGTGTGTQTNTGTCQGTCSDGTCTLGATKSITQSCSNCEFV